MSYRTVESLVLRLATIALLALVAYGARKAYVSLSTSTVLSEAGAALSTR